MLEDRARTREHELAIRSERVHGMLRIAGGGAGIGLLFHEAADHPEIVWRGELVQWVLFALVGVATVVLTTRRPAGTWIRPFRGLTLGIDAVVLLSQIPIHAYAGSHIDPSPALLVPLLAGIKYAYRGLALGIGSLLLAEAIWASQATSLHGIVVGQAVEEIILNAVMGLALGVLAAHLSHTARQGRLAADEAADRAEFAALLAAQARGEIEALHEVLQAGLGRSEVAAAEQMVATLARTLEADVVLRLEQPDTEAPVLVSSHGRRVARDGHEAVASSRIGTSEEPLGELHITASGLAPDEVVMARLADQLAVALRAARQLDVQARVAERHRELERLKTDFIAITSHELRTPLGSISAAADTLFERHDILNEETRLALTATIMRNAARLERLVDDLLVVGRHDAGVLPFNSQPVRVHRVVNDAVETCDDIRVRVIEGPPARVHADPMRVNQIMVNLVNNAATHGEPPIEITWNVTGDVVVLQVWDHGDGIEEDDRERVFERFVQLEWAERHTGGTGLGLPIARDLARAMGGDVRIDSLPEGTVASVRLPLSTEPEPELSSLADGRSLHVRA